MKERLFYFSWLFVRAALKIDYTKYTQTRIDFNNIYDNAYTDELFRLRQLIHYKYDNLNKSLNDVLVHNEKSIRHNNRGDFEQYVFMREFVNVRTFVKTLPNWCDFYLELIKLINAGDDRKTIEWLVDKGVNLADMWKPKEPEETALIKEDGVWEWSGKPFELIFDLKTFGEHYLEYGHICEFLHGPRFMGQVSDVLDKALLIEHLSNKQDLIDYLKTFSEIAKYHSGVPRYRVWVIHPCNIKFMERWVESQPQQATKVEQELKTKTSDYTKDTILNYLRLEETEKEKWIKEIKDCTNYEELAQKINRDAKNKILVKVPSRKGGGLCNLLKAVGLQFEMTETAKKRIRRLYGNAFTTSKTLEKLD